MRLLPRILREHNPVNLDFVIFLVGGDALAAVVAYFVWIQITAVALAALNTLSII